MRADAASQLERAVDRARSRGGSKVDGYLAEGRAAAELIERAQGADLLVVGVRHQADSLHVAVLGSVAEAVLSRPPCPVVVVREELIASDR